LFKRDGRGPWIASWYDHAGRRREASTRTTDKAAAERILSKRVTDAALRRDGVIDATKDRYAVEARKALADHVGDYIEHCRHAGQDKRHVDQKESHLERLREGTGATRLTDLTADLLERHLRTMRAEGLSARSVNFAREIAVALLSWCVNTGRAESNVLRVVPKLDASRDRRRVRRLLTDGELARLLQVAEPAGRKAWYLAAALAGLRRGDLGRLTWAAIDFDAQTVTIRHGKAKREDVIPLHDQLAEALKQRRAEMMALPTAKVFPEAVTNVTRQKDFLRAGLAREEIVTDANGEPVMIGKGKRRRARTRIVCEDDEGRVIDLHAMRTTRGTMLARQGIAPQVAQRIMRHADYRTTQKHYTVLGLTDTAAAMKQVPRIGSDRPAANAATGTYDDKARDALSNAHQLYPQQLGRETVRNAAAQSTDRGNGKQSEGLKKANRNGANCNPERRTATTCVEYPQGDSNPCLQDENLIS